MTGVAAPLRPVRARLRRRPGRWLWPALGIAVAGAFAVGVAAEGTIAGDQGARASLAALPSVDRTVRVTWQGPVTPAVARQARTLLTGLGVGARTQVVLLNPVRLGGVLVRPAAIAPLGPWIASASHALAPCREGSCPMLDVSTPRVPATLATLGARIKVVGMAPLRSPVPLAFSPLAGGSPPVLVTDDVGGLERLPGLSGVYRTYSLIAPLAVARLHAWQLRGIEGRLQRAQATLLASGSQFALSAPFDGLDQARAQADAAPERLLLAGGGAIAALALFVLLVAAGLRRDQLAEVRRLRRAGARSWQCLLFVLAESAWLSAVGLLAGAGIGLLAVAGLAASAGEPVGGVLGHSVATPTGAATLLATWLAATGLMTASLVTRSDRVIDALALVALAVLGVGLAVNPGGNHALAVLVAPLCCVAAGVLTFRAAGAMFRAGEHLMRGGPVRWRLALVGLARAPGLPSAAIAFIAVSVGLGGFALAYRATLLRGAADQAADRVPLDVTVSPGPDFTTPLQLAPLERWRQLAHGPVLLVRRTDAAYAAGAANVTVPALGVPADGLALIHGWRTSDGSARLATLAKRLRPPGPVRVPGPSLPRAGRWLSLRAFSPGSAVDVAAELRDPTGAVTELPLGTAVAESRVLRARLPPGRWELEALELSEPTGLEATQGHQLAENPAGATEEQSTVTLGPARALSSDGRVLLSAPLGAWRTVGAAAPAHRSTGAASASIVFTTTGEPGVIRPEQPSDRRPVPVLVDPQTASAAGRGGRLGLTVDGLPVVATVVGVVRRFPTLPPDAAGFVVADDATLASALDAQLPGQGRPDELWIAGPRLAGLRAALARPPLAGLDVEFRSDLEHALRTTPIARGVLGALAAGAAVAAALAVLGLFASMLGPARDRAVERDLEAQGIGPRALRADLRARLALASVAGVCAGLVVALLLVRLAVAAVRAGATLADPRPALVAIVPVAPLLVWGAGLVAVLLACGALATRGHR